MNELEGRARACTLASTGNADRQCVATVEDECGCPFIVGDVSSMVTAAYKEARNRYMAQCGPILCLLCVAEMTPGLCVPNIGSADAVGVCTSGLIP